MSAWDELVTAGLLGTTRRPLPDGLPDAVRRLAVAPDPGHALLDVAAGYAAARHAGTRPGSAAEPDLAPRQRLDPAPEPAQRLLGALLRTRDVELVDAWLTACTDRGLGVRPGLWADLAAAAAAPHGVDRTLTRRALGERGTAFLRLHPRWRSVAREVDTVEVGATGPTAVSAEATERALAAVQVTRSLGRRSLVVQPLEPDDDLRVLVAGADLDAWERSTRLAPDAFVDVLRRSAGTRQPDPLPALLVGLGEAAVAQRRPDWATALVRTGHAPSALVALVPSAELGRIVAAWVGSRTDADQVARLVGQVPGPWTEPVTAAALPLLTSGRLTPAAQRRYAGQVAHRAALTVHPEVARLAAVERQAQQTRGFVQAEQVLAFRAEIRRTFGTTASQESP